MARNKKTIFTLAATALVATGGVLGLANPQQVIVSVQNTKDGGLTGRALPGYGAGLPAVFSCEKPSDGEAKLSVVSASIDGPKQGTVSAPDCDSAVKKVFGEPNRLGLSHLIRLGTLES